MEGLQGRVVANATESMDGGRELGDKLNAGGDGKDTEELCGALCGRKKSMKLKGKACVRTAMVNGT